MTSKSMLYKISAALLVLTLLSACSTPTTTPTTAPTVPPATATLPPAATTAATSTPAATSTNTSGSATATLAATPTNTSGPSAATPAVTNTPPATPTNISGPATITPAPTLAPTFTPLPPTFTPLPPTATLVPYTPPPYTLTPSSTPTGYACQVTSTSPKSTDTVTVSTNFDFTWNILNTGVKMWGQHNADLKYVSGQSMQTGSSSYNLTADVYGGQTYAATVAMLAPATAGTYTAVWQIVQDSVPVCTLNLSVRVTN